MPLVGKVDLSGTHSRAEEIFRVLRDQINSGVLKPNERLVESAIAAAASISRTPVREALRKLEVSGLVRRTSHGMIVGGITRADLTDACVVREVLEGMAARLAAESRSELDLLGLERVASEYRAAAKAKDPTPLVALNDTFHERIHQMAGNQYLVDQLNILRSTIARSQTTTLVVLLRQRQSTDEHAELVRLIAERRSDEARQLAERHAREAMDIRLSIFDAEQEALEAG